MGRRNRERIARILRGEETPLSARVKAKMHSVGVSVLQAMPTSNQVQFLAESLHTGKIAPSKLKAEFINNAHREMRKGAEKINKQGRSPTVDLLLKEYRADNAFKRLAAEVGLDEQWFVNLAQAECKRWRSHNGG